MFIYKIETKRKILLAIGFWTKLSFERVCKIILVTFVFYFKIQLIRWWIFSGFHLIIYIYITLLQVFHVKIMVVRTNCCAVCVSHVSRACWRHPSIIPTISLTFFRSSLKWRICWQQWHVGEWRQPVICMDGRQDIHSYARNKLT
jgi:hypothetical protein